jgi:hypothetical protein
LVCNLQFRPLAGVLALFVAGTLVLAQQPPADEPEPPVLLKKKNSKSAPLPKPDAGEPPAKEPPPAKDDARKPQPMPPEEKQPQPDEPPVEEDEAEVLARIARNVKKSEDRLAQRDTGQGTQQLQRDILKDLDALIDKMKQPPSDPMGGEGGGKSGPSGQSSARSSKGQPGKGSRSSSQQAGKSPGSQPSGAGSSSVQGNQPKGSGGSQAGHGGGEGQPNDPNKLADVFKDIWGDLPRMLRVEMDAYAREAFMLKYNDLLKQYYATIAEKGRKKGSEP